MHGQVAKALEKLNQNQVESLAGEIATHYEESGNAQTAMDWLERAMTHARMTLSANSCIEYSERCLRLLDTTLPIANRAEKQVRILLISATGYSLKNGFGSKKLLPACKKIEELLPYVDDPEIRCRAIYLLRLNTTFSYQTYSALRLTELQLSAAHDTGLVTIVIEAIKARGFVLFQLGRLPESLNCLESGLKIALTAESKGQLDRHRPSWSLVMLSKIRIQILYLTGRINDALSENQIGPHHEQCVGDPQTRSFVYMWEAENHFIRNRPIDAEKIGKEMVRVGLKEQLTQVECLGSFFCDWAEWKKGNTQEAIARLKRTITRYESQGSHISLSTWYHTLAEMQYSANQFDEALQSNSNAVQATRHTRVFNRKADIYRVRANILAAKNAKSDEVIRLYDLSLKTALKQSVLIYAVTGLIDKITFLRKHQLPVEADLRRLREVVSNVQVSSDFAPLAKAQELLDEFSEV